MPNEKWETERVPQPPDVATGIVIIAVAGFLAFVALSMTGLFFYLRTGAPGAFRQASRTSISRASAAEKAAGRSEAVRT